MSEMNTPIGLTNFRNKKTKFGIKLDDRRRHTYVIGKTGSGKTTLLEHMVISDMREGHGVGVIDPHGEFAERMLDFVPEERVDDVVYFNPADMEYPIAFNPMEQVGEEFRHLVASGLMGVFKKMWPDAWSARMEYILNNTLLALLELPDSTLLSIMRMFAEPNYRKKVVDHIQDPVIKAFWANEFARYTQRLESEALAAIQNKIGQLVSNPLIRNVLGQGHSTINMREVMDKKKILIVNLSKGRIGEDNSKLLGAMIITRLQLAAMSRIDLPEDDRPDFFLYVDEFQNFATESFANILSEARKYHLSLILAHQYIGQLVDQDSTKVRDAVFGNVGTIASFRVGGPDAEFLEKEFEPEFMQNDLVNLPKANIYIKLMIDGIASRPFSAETMPPQLPPLITFRDAIIKNSQTHYGTPRKVVEEKIASEWNEEAGQMIEKKFERREERPIAAALGGMMRPSRPAMSRPPPQSMSGSVHYDVMRKDTPPQAAHSVSPIAPATPIMPVAPVSGNQDAKSEQVHHVVFREPQQENAKAADVILKRNQPRQPSSERFPHLPVDTDALKQAIAASLAKHHPAKAEAADVVKGSEMVKEIYQEHASGDAAIRGENAIKRREHEADNEKESSAGEEKPAIPKRIVPPPVLRVPRPSIPTEGISETKTEDIS